MSNNTNQTTIEQNIETTTDFTIDVAESKTFEYPVIADGVYNATVEKVTMKSNIRGKDGYFNMLVWSFVVDDDGTMKFVDGTSSAKLTSMSKAYVWVASILGKALEVGVGFTPSMVVGKRCQVVVKNVTVNNTYNGKTTQMIKPEIKDVLMIKKVK